MQSYLYPSWRVVIYVSSKPVPTGRDLTARAIKKNYFPAAICPFQLLKLIAPLIFCNKLFFLLFLYSTYENPRFSQVLLNPGLDGRVLALI
jgi:hypothetical protein